MSFNVCFVTILLLPPRRTTEMPGRVSWTLLCSFRLYRMQDYVVRYANGLSSLPVKGVLVVFMINIEVSFQVHVLKYCKT